MTLQDLSSNAQDYLKVIWGFHEWGRKSVQPSDLAKRTHVKPSTISGAVAKLVAGGYVIHDPYGAIELTEAGERYALAMVRRHRLLETFLISTLRYTWDEVHEEADSLEHAASDTMIERIDEMLGHPLTDPHGDPIPGVDGKVPEVEGVLLADAPQGCRARMVRVSDEDPGLLRYLHDEGLGLGSVVLIGDRGPYADATTVLVVRQDTPADGDPDHRIVLSAAASRRIRVRIAAKKSSH